MSKDSNVSLRLPSIIPHKPSPKQAAFLLYSGLEAFYGGAAGGGKTDALLMAALQYIDQPGYAAMIFRRSYTDLALPGAIMDRAREWIPKDVARWDRETHTFHFPSGASLSFGYVQTRSDVYRYQSSELQFLGWDEVTEFPEDDAYTFMFSRLRKLEGVELPLRVRSASNPVGIGTYWVRKRFIEEGTPDRIFIPATFQDNPHIDREAYLRSLQELHPSLQKRLIEGGWDEIEDAAFPEFDPGVHVIPSISPPGDWRTWEAMDFGVTNPTAWLAASLSPEGDTVVFGEYYKPGLISDHASSILTLRNLSWGHPSIALCDPSVQNRTGFGSHGRGETVHSEFSKNGIYLVPANNDRRAGFVRIGELLRADPSRQFPNWHPKAGEYGAPRLYFTENCTNLIEQIRFAPVDSVDGETVDGWWESRRGHAVAAARYLLTARVFPKETEPTPLEGRRHTKKWNSWDNWQEVG